MIERRVKGNRGPKRNAKTIAEQAERVGVLLDIPKIPKHRCGWMSTGKEIRFDCEEDTYTLMDILVKLAENQAELFKLLTKSEPKKKPGRKPKRNLRYEAEQKKELEELNKHA